jgi:hypothetical protein
MKTKPPAAQALRVMAASAIFFLGLGWTSWFLVGRPLIRVMYHRAAPVAALNRIIEGQDVHALEHYYAVGAQAVWIGTLAALLLSAVFGGAVLISGLRSALARAGLAALLYLAAAEGLMRGLLFTERFGWPALRRHVLFAHSGGEVFWKLRAQWTPSVLPPPARVHPLRGWSRTEVSTANPLGLEETTLQQLERSGEKVFFYGDSYVRGGTLNPDFWIPGYLDRRRPDIDVVDLGVSGYGVDQSYLMFRETVERAERPAILFGIFLPDMDRTLLSFREWQKPRFRTRGAALDLTNVPIEPDQAAYLRAHPAPPGSFALRLLYQAANRLLSLEERELLRRRRVRQLNHRILQELQSDCGRRGLPLHVVIFYLHHHLDREDWRERALKDTARQLRIPIVDTKVILKEYARTTGTDIRLLYDYDTANGNHHSELGNQVIAEGILKVLSPEDSGRGSLPD